MKINGLEVTPENWAKLQRALDLHGLKDVRDLPGSEDPNTVAFFLDSTERLIGRHGEDWVRQNKERLLLEMKIVAEM